MSREPLTEDERELAASLFVELFDELAAIGQEPDGGHTRLAWTAASAEAGRWFDATAARLGLETSVDHNGNRWAGPPEAHSIVTGSHFDTVPHGGRVDGALGVVAGLIAVHLVNRRGPTARPLAVVAFADEEGGRFNTPTFGSRLMVGALDPEGVLDRRDDDGVRLRGALEAAGLPAQLLGHDEEALARIGAFVELHVEQGHLLRERNQPLGVAATIKPHGRWRIDMVGEANHGGTTELSARCDPMLALAELLLAARRAAHAEGALVTVGKLEVWPNASNSIAQRVSGWLDVRGDDDAAIGRIVEDVTGAVAVVCRKHGVDVRVSRESQVARVVFSEELRARIATRLAQFGLEAVPLDTGAGHDAGTLAAVVPSAMLFVRSTSGVSHSAAEHARVTDCVGHRRTRGRARRARRGRQIPPSRGVACRPTEVTMSERAAIGQQPPVHLGVDPVSAEDVLRVARHDAPVVVSDGARARLASSWQRVVAVADSEDPVYGVSTGLGALSTTRISRACWGELQESLVLSHAAGMGPAVEREVVRALMFLRARTLTLGYSGVRPALVDAIVAVLNCGYTPIVPEYGSLGASGDLAPLAHASLVLLGEGEVSAADGTRQPASVALEAAGIEPLVLGPKEGLSLINGTDGMLGMLLLACADFEVLCRTAEVAAAMSVEALLGTDTAFAATVNELRPHPGQLASAANLTRVMADSAIVASHRENDTRVQDAYSMRCAPQVIGAARDVLEYARRVADIELRSAVDNPSVLLDGRIVSNGNFHGIPLAFAADFLAIACAEVGSIAERRVDRLLDVTRSMGLPPFLADTAGVHSGLMIAQYTAAALVAENRRLASPASVDSIPTSGMQEDHVSMGWAATRKLRQALDNLTRIIGIELTCAARALVLRSPLRPSPASAAVAALVDSQPGPDRVLAPELARAERLVRSGAVVNAVTAVIGELR